MLKVTGSLQKSTEIMKLSNQLIKLPELSAAMRQMSMEMTKASRLVVMSCRPLAMTRAPAAHTLFADSIADLPRPPALSLALSLQAGIMEEMMDETLDGLDEDQDELEDEADAEVDKVLYDLTDGKLGVLGATKGAPLTVRLASPSLAAVVMQMSDVLAYLQATPVEEEEDEAETVRMQKQLQDLLSS